MLRCLVYVYLVPVVLISISEGKKTNEERGYYEQRAVSKTDPSKGLSETEPVVRCEVTVPSRDDKEKVVNFFNSMRRRIAKGLENRGYNGSTFPEASNMLAWGYSGTLENMAREWALSCNPGNTIPSQTVGYNINNRIVTYTSTIPLLPMDYRLYAETYYNELIAKFYGPDALQPFNGRNSQTGADVKAFANIGGAKMRSVGCAQSVYFDKANKKHTRVVVCLFGGRMEANAPLYKEGEPCSDVAPNYCDNGLVTDDLKNDESDC